MRGDTVQQRCARIARCLASSAKIPWFLQGPVADLEHVVWNDDDYKVLVDASVRALRGDLNELCRLLLRKHEKVLRIIR